MAEGRDPLGFWLSKLGSDNTRKVFGQQFARWLKWLHTTHKEYSRITPSELIEKQKAAVGDEEYEILDLLQDYVGSLVLARRSLIQAYTAVRSFFAYNRAQLPTDKVFKIKGKRPPAPSNLTIPTIARIINAADLRDKSLLLCKWMSLLDTAGICYMNQNLGGYISNEIKADHCPILIEIPGRKGELNEANYFTFMGSDAIQSLKEYFAERGYPKEGEPIWLDKFGKALSYAMVGDDYRNLLRRLRIIPKKGSGNVWARYGYGIHEFRDCARTYLHIRAKAENLDLQAVEFWMGHTSQLDPNRYDRFYQDKEYMTAQYVIAQKWLNILTNPAYDGRLEDLRLETSKEISTLKAQLAESDKSSKQMREAIRAVRTKALGKARKIEIAELLDNMLRGEGAEISEDDILEARELSGTLRKLAEIEAKGETSQRFMLESFVTEERATRLITKFYHAIAGDSHAPKQKKPKHIAIARLRRRK